MKCLFFFNFCLIIKTKIKLIYELQNKLQLRLLDFKVVNLFESDYFLIKLLLILSSIAILNLVANMCYSPIK